MRQTFFLFAVLTSLISVTSLATPGKQMPFSADASIGQWLQFRGNPALTGRSLLKGNITYPAIRWRQFNGARETWLSVRLGGRSTRKTALPTQDLQASHQQVLSVQWGVGGPWFDLTTNGSFQAVGPDVNSKTGHLLPKLPGIQRFEFDSAFKYGGAAQSFGDVPIYGRLMVRKGGEWEQVWQSERIRALFVPLPITGDFDGDGKPEVAVLPWYDIIVLDAETGTLKGKCRFVPEGAESGRAYGWFGAFDLNKDGKSEFILLSDFEGIMGVFGWKDGQLQPYWQRLVERGSVNKKTVLLPGTQPIQDVDGDGKPEICISLFNATGDEKWHVLVLDGMTGETRFDLPNAFLTGICDVDGDGAAELFCTHTTTRLVPEPADLSVVSFRRGKSVTRWNLHGATFQTQPLADFLPNVNSCSGTGRVTLLAGPVTPGGRPVFVTRKTANAQTGATELTIWQADARGRITAKGSLTGPHLEALAIRDNAENGGVLVKAAVPGDEPASINSSHLLCQALISRRISMPLSPPVVARLGKDALPSVVVEGACETITAFHPPTGQRAAVNQWRVPGRSIVPLFGTSGGVMAADLLADGQQEVITATRGIDGCARLTVIQPDGTELWHHDFPRFPGPPPPWNVGGLTYWFVGHFTDPQRYDVMVSLRRSITQSDETFVLDGRTGEELWHRTQGWLFSPGDYRACGGNWVAVYDHDGDGLDDAVLTHPDGVLVMKGSTGENLLARRTVDDIFQNSYYGQPAVADFLGTGALHMLYSGNGCGQGVMKLNGDPLWKVGGIDNSPAGIPKVQLGIGDIDGEGKLELVSPGYAKEPELPPTEFRSIDAATGEVKWTLPIEGAPTAVATADIDDDGRDECLFTIGCRLYAVGTTKDRKAGEVRWTLDFPSWLGAPAIADTDGSGKASIVVTCADGYVYGVGLNHDLSD